MRDLFRMFVRRVAALFRRRPIADDVDAEMRSHLELATEQNQRKGVGGGGAWRGALRRWGGVEEIKEGYRDQRGLPMIEGVRQDLRCGLRMRRRSPGVSALAILCLTLGIGSNTAVSSWIEGILLRPYPLVAHQDRRRGITGTSRGVLGADNSRTEVSWPDLVDLQRNCKLFDWFIVDRITGTTLSIGDRAQVATGSIVSSNYFDALGIHPVLGRGFRPEEAYGRTAHPVTVISYQMWQDRFHGDPQIIGKTQMMDSMPHTIIGVAPEGFYGTFVGWAMQFWVPVSMQERFDSSQPGYKLEDRGARWIEGYARVKPGVTPEQAQQEISAIAKRLELDYPETKRVQGVKLVRLSQMPFNIAVVLLPTLGIAAAVVAFVLLIVCANVSNLLLVRAFG